ncbi:hypothetical protein OOZ15_00360 [Galbibacter sp. EGI 63066]|uniref:hypothetical protein n=1 Tax=Galbibacter sp. EGI 63066 TaxID=2993559 RepID=UPI002248B39D|nr:hypothetical protein [Galbibacter sp. EGI 63066]MCX2678381.1 hypothetical protein [Galbibacter sp. EGI 63066]
MVPNYGGIIELDDSNPQYKVELHFYKSFLNNVYSVQLVYLNNQMTIKRDEEYLGDFIGAGVEKLVVSPMKGYYNKEFELVEDFLNCKFTNSIFLPYSVEKLRLKNLEITYHDKPDCQIGEAFFSKGMPNNFYWDKIPNIVGNENYKLKELQ